MKSTSYVGYGDTSIGNSIDDVVGGGCQTALSGLAHITEGIGGREKGEAIREKYEHERLDNKSQTCYHCK